MPCRKNIVHILDQIDFEKSAYFYQVFFFKYIGICATTSNFKMLTQQMISLSGKIFILANKELYNLPTLPKLCEMSKCLFYF